MPKNRIDEIRARLEAVYREGFSAPWVDDIACLLDLLDELKPHLDVAIEACDLYIPSKPWTGEVDLARMKQKSAARAALKAIKEKLG